MSIPTENKTTYHISAEAAIAHECEYRTIECREVVRDWNATSDPIKRAILSDAADTLSRSRDVILHPSGDVCLFPEKMAKHDDLFIIVAAFRYAMGRHSYAPGLVADWIKQRVEDIPPHTRAAIAGEIREAEAYDHRAEASGKDAYRQLGNATSTWLSLAEFLEAHSPE